MACFSTASHSCKPSQCHHPWENSVLSPMKKRSSPAGRPGQDSDRISRGRPAPPAPLPSCPGTPGANQSVAELPVVESRARDPPLFVAVANGRVRNIGGCPGDSVICHRITFENGTWNEATAAAAPAAPAAPGPGPAAAVAAAAPAARRSSAAMRPAGPR